MADPAEAHVLVMPLGPAQPLAEADVKAALDQVKLTELVLADPGSWQHLDALVAIPGAPLQKPELPFASMAASRAPLR